MSLFPSPALLSPHVVRLERWVAAWGVAGAATGGLAVILLPIVYRLGHHVGAYLIDFVFHVYPAMRELLS